MMITSAVYLRGCAISSVMVIMMMAVVMMIMIRMALCSKYLPENRERQDTYMNLPWSVSNNHYCC